MESCSDPDPGTKGCRYPIPNLPPEMMEVLDLFLRLDALNRYDVDSWVGIRKGFPLAEVEVIARQLGIDLDEFTLDLLADAASVIRSQDTDDARERQES